MKLTPRSQGYRFRKPHWLPYEFIDIRRVGRSVVMGFDQDGRAVEFNRDEMDIDWERLGSSVACKRDSGT